MSSTLLSPPLPATFFDDVAARAGTAAGAGAMTIGLATGAVATVGFAAVASIGAAMAAGAATAGVTGAGMVCATGVGIGIGAGASARAGMSSLEMTIIVGGATGAVGMLFTEGSTSGTTDVVAAAVVDVAVDDSSERTKRTAPTITTTASNATKVAATVDAVIRYGEGGGRTPRRVLGAAGRIQGLSADESCGWTEGIERRDDIGIGIGAATCIGAWKCCIAAS